MRTRSLWTAAVLAPLLWVVQACALPIIGAHAEPSRRPRAAHARERADAERSERSTSRPRTQPARSRQRAYDDPPAPPEPSSPAYALASIAPTGGGCYQQLARAGVAFERVRQTDARGVRYPTRLTGPIHGVEIGTRDKHAAHTILDCRLALSLVQWARSLRRAGVRRLEHYSMYRPGARVGGDGKVSGHARGLAIDAARFELEDGLVIDVLTDWEDRDRDTPPCPRRGDEGRAARILRSVVCDAVSQNLFQVVLTPHHDAAHANHVHLELRPDSDWTYVR